MSFKEKNPEKKSQGHSGEKRNKSNSSNQRDNTINDINEKRSFLINILSKAIKTFYQNDIDLFKLKKEETLNSRIAFYIERELENSECKEYHADVEYTVLKDVNKEKKDKEKKKDSFGKGYVDILVSKRLKVGALKNNVLMAIEVKRENNYTDIREDRNRLTELIRPNQPDDSSKDRVVIYGAVLGVLLRLKEEKGATAELYYYKSSEVNARIKTKIISYEKENDYNPQIGAETEIRTND